MRLVVLKKSMQERWMNRIGWVGTGVMGRSMVLNLIKAGNELTVFSRTRSKANDVIAEGAQWADSPLEAAREKDFVCTMVGKNRKM